MSYDNTNKGILGRNKRKEKDTHPDHSGTINIEGVEYWLSAWIKTSQQTGEKFFSLSVKPKEQRQSPASKRESDHIKDKSNGYAPSEKAIDEDGEEIPF